MDFCNLEEHTTCYNYDNSDHAMIDVWNIEKGETSERVARYNTVVFILKGEMLFLFQDYPETSIKKNSFIFVPLGAHVRYTATNDTELLLVRMYDHVRLCESYGIEQLFMGGHARYATHGKVHCPLEANKAILDYITSLYPFIDGNFRCKYYHDIKVKEFFVLLRIYYSNEQLRDFFHKILSIDTAFVEVVKYNYRSHNTAHSLAKALNYSFSGFSSKFKAVFGVPVYTWMKEQKTRAIYKEICTSTKTFKEIASDFGFTSSSQFIDFCKANLGEAPGKIRKRTLIS